MIPDLIGQWMRIHLASAASRSQLGKSSHSALQPVQLVGGMGASASTLSSPGLSANDSVPPTTAAYRNSEGAAKHKVGGAIDAVAERVEEVFSRDEHEDPDD